MGSVSLTVGLFIGDMGSVDMDRAVVAVATADNAELLTKTSAVPVRPANWSILRRMHAIPCHRADGDDLLEPGELFELLVYPLETARTLRAVHRHHHARGRGAVMLLIEVAEPGYFIGVPTTVRSSSVFSCCRASTSSTPSGACSSVLRRPSASALVTIPVYSRLTPNRMPTTISRDPLVGWEGTVVRPVDEETIDGKVRIGITEWSARSVPGTISVGKRVVVVRSEGVHVVVQEID